MTIKPFRTVNIYNRQRKFKCTDELRNLIFECCETALICENFDKVSTVDVTLVSNNKIRQYNREYRNIDRATDVLSFPMGENGEYDVDPETGSCLLGDIVISLEKAASQAEEYGHSYEREVGFLTVHSMLHLLGYDHIEEPEGDIMRAHEKIILDKIGLTR